ncbi:MAG TPA: cytidylate kinase family protein [bacterium]|nr:cytidylate kinase family protein [Patescibacteria group bacterium]HPO11073.1 cytidylate kinase family protein [bacterium]
MFKKIITITGKAGCGKSTVADLLAKKLNYRILSSGDQMRKIAKQYNMNIVDFVGKYLPEHKEIDYKLDNLFLDICKKEEDIIIPTRVMTYILEKNNIEHFKVFLYATKDVRIKRIYEREGGKISDIKKKLEERDYLDSIRYKDLYRIDINDLSMYNLILYTHFTKNNFGKIRIKIKQGNKFFIKYIKSKDTLPSTLADIIINEYKEYARRN